jgi:aminomethyltransferase
MRTSPLDATHRFAGAKMVPFGGWDMPLSYAEGTVAEHMACRNGAVAFDVSHLGTVRVQGDRALGVLQRALTNDLTKVGPGRAQYTHLCNDDGFVVDDIIVWWRRDDMFDVMPNASNTDGVVSAVGGVDVTSERAIIAVQGPLARQKVGSVSEAMAAVGRFQVVEMDWHGVPIVVAGTGYTGEDGIEIAVPADAAARLWDALIAAGVQPAGLGARDTLRLEAGLPLHGHELGMGITPLQAGLGWVVAWDKDTFTGKDALVSERARGVSRRLRGIVVEGRRPPRAECAVLINDAVVGEVTSGNFSPVLGVGIALAFIPPDVALGAPVSIDVRGSRMPGVVAPTPFVPKH